MAEVAGVHGETIGGHGDLHAGADGGGGTGLGDDEGEEIGGLGPDGLGRLGHESQALVGGGGGPAGQGVASGGGGRFGIGHGAWGAVPTTSSVAGLMTS